MRFCPLSAEKLRFLHEKLSPFEVLFNEHIGHDLDAFINLFIRIDEAGEVHARGLMWEVDDVGILFLTDIVPESEGSAHFTFWDQRFRGREPLIREGLKYAFETFKFHRITTQVPLYQPHTMAAVERVGFVKEGRKRQAVRYRGEWYDLNLYAILESEV